ncbi:hypothetical protein [Desulfovibrio litoralis]|uniref:Uncharacterized protein n=1 Tax=Desulfovibrio litoralis DSM 11393 TaxID=1121455 RepID=A0A1M7SQP7_9BACT|nr:hypothetical protein [Desulfovibrio litoralis]SHN60805.1 hypothetical protein SAMN02745728_01160 [Desulfovibrio litoralis DSM 11393]
MLNHINNTSNFDDYNTQQSAAQLLSKALLGSLNTPQNQNQSSINNPYGVGDQVSISPEARRLIEEIIASHQQDKAQQLNTQDDTRDETQTTPQEQINHYNIFKNKTAQHEVRQSQLLAMTNVETTFRIQ